MGVENPEESQIETVVLGVLVAEVTQVAVLPSCGAWTASWRFLGAACCCFSIIGCCGTE